MTDILCITWRKFHSDTVQLSKLIKKNYANTKFMGIVSIMRGGAIPAVIISHELKIKNIETVTISSYGSDNKQKEKIIVKKDNNMITSDDNGVWLIIDELSDTGSSIKELKKYLPNSIYATVYCKPKGAKEIDITSVIVDQGTWITFPWEFYLGI